jgi:carboxypeptidase Q
VVLNQAMPTFNAETQETGYRDTVPIRSSGASEAAKVGAKALLIRSVTASSLRTPHTGAVRYAEGVAKIPAAAITLEDAELLARLSARGPTQVELSLGAKLLPDAVSGNAIAELRGRELPDEVVVIGGHIDSWDVGDGSTRRRQRLPDGDGRGALLLKELGLRAAPDDPRGALHQRGERAARGDRVSRGAQGKERHVAAIEADVGQLGRRGVSGSAGRRTQAAIKAIQAYAPLFHGARGRSRWTSGRRRG